MVENNKGGRPRIKVDIELIRHLKDKEQLGWSRVQKEYFIRTGHYISRDTLKRRYWDKIYGPSDKLGGFKFCRYKVLRYPIKKKVSATKAEEELWDKQAAELQAQLDWEQLNQ